MDSLLYDKERSMFEMKVFIDIVKNLNPAEIAEEFNKSILTWGGP